MIKIYICLFVLMLSNNFIMGQTVVEHKVTSKFFPEEETRIVKIWLPYNYKINPPSQVIYVFDAEEYFDIVSANVNYYMSYMRIPQTAVVGVYYRELGDRTDVGFLTDSKELDTYGEAFYKYTKEEVKPLINQYLSSNHFSIFCGHSYLANYADWYLLNNPDFFDAYMLFAPEVSKLPLIQQNNIENKRIFISAGALDLESRIEYAGELGEVFKSLGNNKVKVHFEESTEHNFVLIKSFAKALEFIYNDFINIYNINTYITKDKYRTIHAFDEVNKKNYKIGITRSAGNLLTLYYEFIKHEDFDSESFLNEFKNINDANLCEILGGLYSRNNMPDEAIKYLEKSIKLYQQKNINYQSHNAHRELYTVYSELLKDTIKALNVLDEAIIALPRYNYLKYIKGVELIKNKRSIQDGISSLDDYLKDYKYDEFPKPLYLVYYYLGYGYFLNNDVRKSVIFLEKSINENPDYNQSKELLLNINKGDFSSAPMLNKMGYSFKLGFF